MLLVTYIMLYHIIYMVHIFVYCYFNISDWTGNPNTIENEVKWTDWVSTQKFFDAGANGTFGFREQKSDPREDRCNLWDRIDEYMLH